MAVDGRVDRKDKLGEVDEEAGLLRSDKPAATLGHVFAEAVERHRKSRNVKNVADKKTFPVKLKSGCAAA
jgi:hypothetical protein